MLQLSNLLKPEFYCLAKLFDILGDLGFYPLLYLTKMHLSVFSLFFLQLVI